MTAFLRTTATARQGLAYGVQHAGGSIAPLLAGLSLPVISIPLGWTWAFVMAAVLAAAALALTPTAPRPAPAAREKPAAGPSRRLTPVHALAVAAGLGSAAALGMATFLVVYAVESGMSDAHAGLLLAAVSLAAATGRVVLGAAADRQGSDPLLPIAVVLVASSGGYLLLIAGTPIAIAVGALIVGGAGWGWSGALTLALVRMAPEATWAVGAMMSGTFAGAVGGPLIVGLLAEHGSWVAGWTTCAALALASAATIAVTRRVTSLSAVAGC